MKTVKGYPLKREHVNFVAALESKIDYFIANPTDKESFYYSSKKDGTAQEEIGGISLAIREMKKIYKDLDDIYVDPHTISARVELIELFNKHKNILTRPDIEGCVKQVFGKGLLDYGNFEEGNTHKRNAHKEIGQEKKNVFTDVWDDLSERYLDWAKFELNEVEAACEVATKGGAK